MLPFPATLFAVFGDCFGNNLLPFRATTAVEAIIVAENGNIVAGNVAGNGDFVAVCGNNFCRPNYFLSTLKCKCLYIFDKYN